LRDPGEREGKRRGWAGWGVKDGLRKKGKERREEEN
jgi:hypothetical protein